MSFTALKVSHSPNNNSQARVSMPGFTAQGHPGSLNTATTATTAAWSEGHAIGQADGYNVALEGLRQAVLDVIIHEFDLVPGDVHASTYTLEDAATLRAFLMVVLEAQSMNDVRHWLELRGVH